MAGRFAFEKMDLVLSDDLCLQIKYQQVIMVNKDGHLICAVVMRQYHQLSYALLRMLCHAEDLSEFHMHVTNNCEVIGWEEEEPLSNSYRIKWS